MDTAPTIAAIDIGTNSVHMVVARRLDGGAPEILTREKEPVRLGRGSTDMKRLEPAAIDHFDSGQIMLEAAAQGLGIAIMHDDHMRRAADTRLATLFDVDVESPYSYWFVCKPTALEERPVRLFHDWLVKAGL